MGGSVHTRIPVLVTRTLPNYNAFIYSYPDTLYPVMDMNVPLSALMGG